MVYVLKSCSQLKNEEYIKIRQSEPKNKMINTIISITTTIFFLIFILPLIYNNILFENFSLLDIIIYIFLITLITIISLVFINLVPIGIIDELKIRKLNKQATQLIKITTHKVYKRGQSIISKEIELVEPFEEISKKIEVLPSYYFLNRLKKCEKYAKNSNYNLELTPKGWILYFGLSCIVFLVVWLILGILFYKEIWSMVLIFTVFISIVIFDVYLIYNLDKKIVPKHAQYFKLDINIHNKTQTYIKYDEIITQISYNEFYQSSVDNRNYDDYYFWRSNLYIYNDDNQLSMEYI